MKLWLNVETVRRCARFMEWRNTTPRWYVCPRCRWFGQTIVGVDEPFNSSPVCPRPVNDTAAALSTFVFSHRQKVQTGEICEGEKMLWLDELAPRVSDAMFAALRMHGPNAVIEILDGLGPVEIGLDDPGGAVSASSLARLEQLRPDSVRRKR